MKDYEWWYNIWWYMNIHDNQLLWIAYYFLPNKLYYYNTSTSDYFSLQSHTIMEAFRQSEFKYRWNPYPLRRNTPCIPYLRAPQLFVEIIFRGSCARQQDIVRFQVQVTNQLRMPGLQFRRLSADNIWKNMEQEMSTEAQGQILHSLAENDWD